MISGGPTYALFLKTNARGQARSLNNEARSVYFSPRDGCPLGGWARRPLLSLETKGNTVTAPPVSPPFLNAVARLQRAHTNSLHSRMRQVRASAARQFMRACCNNYMWWPSVCAFLRYECTGPSARSFLQGLGLCPWVDGPGVVPFFKLLRAPGILEIWRPWGCRKCNFL